MINEATYDFSVLRDLRRREGLTQRAVSERSGISPAVISKLERNQSLAELTTLHRLARVFDLTATDLVGLAERRTAQTALERTHEMSGFSFREIAYGKVKALYVTALAGSRISRPEIHKDDYEMCWVLSGDLNLELPTEQHHLIAGQAIQFDAILEHTYEAVSDCTLIILHLRKGKRF